MLQDVTSKVIDGLTGKNNVTGDGKHIKIGVSPVVSASPITINGDAEASKIKEALGLSPLADAVMVSVQAGAATTYCIPVAASAPGKVNEVKKTGDGSGNMTVEGNPNNAFDVIVKFTAQGRFNTGIFTVSTDGGNTFSDEITVPVAGSYEIPGTGLTLKFTEGEDLQADSSFLANDTFTFDTTAPTMTNGDVLAALDKVKNFHETVEYIHIVGECDLSLWQAVSEKQIQLATNFHNPVFMLLEAKAPTAEDMEGGDLNEWARTMAGHRQKIKNYNIQVCAAWGPVVKMDGTTQTMNLASIAAGLYSKAKVHESIGKTRDGAGFGISKAVLLDLLPVELDDSIIEILDNGGYLTFRAYNGLNDFYVYHAKMLSPDRSDFQFAEDVRVLNKIRRNVRQEGLQFMNDDIDSEDIQAELDARASFLATPLQKMIDNKEISAAQVTAPAGQEETVRTEGKFKVRVRYVSRGYIREIEVEIGRVLSIE